MPKFRDPLMRMHMRISVHEDPRKRMHMQISKDGDPWMRMQMRIFGILHSAVVTEYRICTLSVGV